LSKYAEGTDVPVDRSRGEIERTLVRYGADQFMFGWKESGAIVAFRAKGRHIRFTLPLPSAEEVQIRWNQHTRGVPEEKLRAKSVEQAIMQRWRALALCIKAKLEAVAAGITTFEEEFMAHVVMPNGETLAEHALPLIARAYETGKMPTNLLEHLK
jgi:hypothetical protein